MHSFSRLFEHFLRCLPRPFNRFPDEWRQERLRKEVRRRVRNSRSGWRPRPKVFGIGLSKTGTTSLSDALQHLGYDVIHWKRYNTSKIIDWPEFFYADAVTDTPCSALFEPLYYTFEESKFIYTERSIDTWKQSIVNHFGIEHPGQLRSGFEEVEKDRPRPYSFHNFIHWVHIHESLYAQYDSWEEAYHKFDNRVKSFFSDKPDSRFLEMNIIDGDVWEVLCSFLDKDIPSQPFPHKKARR